MTQKTPSIFFPNRLLMLTHAEIHKRPRSIAEDKAMLESNHSSPTGPDECFHRNVQLGYIAVGNAPQYALADFLQSCLSCSIMSSANMALSKAADFVVLQMGL